MRLDKKEQVDRKRDDQRTEQAANEGVAALMTRARTQGTQSSEKRENILLCGLES